MYNKWGILWRPIRTKIENVPHIITAITRLHNYTINERLLTEGNFDVKAELRMANIIIDEENGFVAEPVITVEETMKTLL